VIPKRNWIKILQVVLPKTELSRSISVQATGTAYYLDVSHNQRAVPQKSFFLRRKVAKDACPGWTLRNEGKEGTHFHKDYQRPQ
jgi:hypothetical protein